MYKYGQAIDVLLKEFPELIPLYIEDKEYYERGFVKLSV